MIVAFLTCCLNSLILDRVIEIHFCPGRFNVADILTKPLAPDQFEFLREFLMHGHGGVVPNFDIHETIHMALAAMSLLD